MAESIANCDTDSPYQTEALDLSMKSPAKDDAERDASYKIKTKTKLTANGEVDKAPPTGRVSIQETEGTKKTTALLEVESNENEKGHFRGRKYQYSKSRATGGHSDSSDDRYSEEDIYIRGSREACTSVIKTRSADNATGATNEALFYERNIIGPFSDKYSDEDDGGSQPISKYSSEDNSSPTLGSSDDDRSTAWTSNTNSDENNDVPVFNKHKGRSLAFRKHPNESKRNPLHLYMAPEVRHGAFHKYAGNEGENLLMKYPGEGSKCPLSLMPDGGTKRPCIKSDDDRSSPPPYKRTDTGTSNSLRKNPDEKTDESGGSTSGDTEGSFNEVCPEIAEEQNGIKVCLHDAKLWLSFAKMGTEMIINRGGRRMFPQVVLSVTGLLKGDHYSVFLEIVPADDKRYKFVNNEWVAMGVADPRTQNQPTMHPDSPSRGSFWEHGMISFGKVKLTNNKDSRDGNVLLHSMHKYLAAVTIRHEDTGVCTGFRFSESTFVAVTAYQNNKITQMKILNNPFAKAFRDSWPHIYPARLRKEMQIKKLKTFDERRSSLASSDCSMSSMSSVEPDILRDRRIPTNRFDERQLTPSHQYLASQLHQRAMPYWFPGQNAFNYRTMLYWPFSSGADMLPYQQLLPPVVAGNDSFYSSEDTVSGELDNSPPSSS